MTPAIGTPAGLSAADVWAAATRTLTGLTGTPRSDLVGSDAALWSHATRKLTNPSGVWDDLLTDLDTDATIGIAMPRIARKTVAFDGAAGNGAVGTVALFTVTGQVFMEAVGIRCTEDLAGAGSLLVGVTGNTNVIRPTRVVSNILNGDVWGASSDPIGMAEAPAANVGGGYATRDITTLSIIATITGADITDGTLLFYVLWRPASADGLLVAA